MCICICCYLCNIHVSLLLVAIVLVVVVCAALQYHQQHEPRYRLAVRAVAVHYSIENVYVKVSPIMIISIHYSI